MSLREQLLKAGLVTSEQVKEVESKGKKKKHEVNKNKTLKKAEQQRKQQQQQQRQQEQAAKREQDKQLNQKRDAVKRRREDLARIRQLLLVHRQNDAEAEQRYNFQAGKKIRSLRVTDQQQRQLAMGRLGIIRNPQDEFDFVIVPRATAQTLAKIDEKIVVQLLEESHQLEEDEWAGWDDE